LASADERLPQFLEAHERAFEHFGGHTREHLYDRPRIVCRPAGEGRFVWNRTFLAFAQYWSFEPRVCRAYRAQTRVSTAPPTCRRSSASPRNACTLSR
jgi:transposase